MRDMQVSRFAIILQGLVTSDRYRHDALRLFGLPHLAFTCVHVKANDDHWP